MGAESSGLVFLFAESGAEYSLGAESSGLDSLGAESNDDFCVLLAESVEYSCVLFAESGEVSCVLGAELESALDVSHFSASRQSLSLSLVTPHC